MSRDQLSHSTDQKRSSPKKLTAPTLAQGGRGLFAFGEIFPLYRRLYEFLRQHRAIRQEVSARIFVPIQSFKNGGILYVFPIFETAEVGQKDG